MENLKKPEQLEPTAFVIFGGAGDLAWRKLLPALFDLSQSRRLPEHFAILAVDRIALNTATLHSRLHEGVTQFSGDGKVDARVWHDFANHIQYLQGDFKNPKTYEALRDYCAQLDQAWQSRAQHIFYLATPPSLFGDIPSCLAQAGLLQDQERARVVLEKPLGYDLESALVLNRTLANSMHESQIFRIDHYLGKETVQNILAFRFANPLFEPIWNRRYVDYVSITVAEAVGVEHRGGYYEQAGALRDMVQNHLMQLLCLVAMEPMVSIEADEIRNKKVDVLHAVRPMSPDMGPQCAVRGQYGPGVIGGETVCGYRQEDGVSPHSSTETFVALQLFVDNWRWQDVPFYLRTGKRLPRQVSEVVMQFRPVPHQAFPPEATHGWDPARLIMSIHPHEGITLRMQAKQPGPQMLLQTVAMQFTYQDTFTVPLPSAYETLLWDVMQHDAHPVHAGRSGRGRVAPGAAGAGGMGGQSRRGFAQLRRWYLGARRSPGAAHCTGSAVATAPRLRGMPQLLSLAMVDWQERWANRAPGIYFNRREERKTVHLRRVLLMVFLTGLVGIPKAWVAHATPRPSDEAISFLVRETLLKDPRMEAADITVDTADGIVTLGGSLPTLSARQYADLEAKKITGVRGVVNELFVTPAMCFDADITQDIRKRFIRSVSITSNGLRVTVNQGKVMLEGTVASGAERQEAGLLAGAVRGVKEVTNKLVVQYQEVRLDAEIQRDVTATLASDAYLNGLLRPC